MKTHVNETNNTTSNTERVTRGSSNRRQTEKYTLFKQSAQTLTVPQDQRDTRETSNAAFDSKSASSMNEDKYILHLCK